MLTRFATSSSDPGPSCRNQLCRYQSAATSCAAISCTVVSCDATCFVASSCAACDATSCPATSCITYCAATKCGSICCKVAQLWSYPMLHNQMCRYQSFVSLYTLDYFLKKKNQEKSQIIYCVITFGNCFAGLWYYRLFCDSLPLLLRTWHLPLISSPSPSHTLPGSKAAPQPPAACSRYQYSRHQRVLNDL
jgi:hypothetical protein